MARCDFCGRYRAGDDPPHPKRATCPYESNHEVLNDSYPDDTLIEAVKNTIPGNSVSLRGWGSAYPVFKTVAETKMWLPSTDNLQDFGSGLSRRSEDPRWKKDILTVADSGTQYRIRYDPESESLLHWYEIEDDSEDSLEKGFGTYLRKQSPQRIVLRRKFTRLTPYITLREIPEGRSEFENDPF